MKKISSLRRLALYALAVGTLAGSSLAAVCTSSSDNVIRASADSSDITDKGDRIFWADASVDLPYNYAGIIGFTITVRLETDQTNYVDGYGGVTEDPDSPEYNMHFPCYMLDVFKGSYDSTVLNRGVYYCAENENYEHIVNEELAANEICKLGFGAGYYVAKYLDNGVGCKEGKDAKAGDEITVTYKSTSSLFEQGNPIMTFFGYTAQFTVLNIDWITGTPVTPEEQEDWSTVEKTTISDVETVENHADQNGSNYINIIEPKEGDGPFPVVLWIHGGGWTTSSRTDIILNMTMEYFLAKGYAFVSAEYTLSDSNAELTDEEQAKVDAASTQEEKDSLTSLYKIKNPTQGKQMIYDLKLAVRYLRANADKYNLDTSFITAMGESAGAHLSLLMATTNDSAEHEGAGGTKYGGWDSYSSDVQCAVTYSTPTDLSNDSVMFLNDYTEQYPLLSTSTLSESARAYNNFLMAYCLLGYSYTEAHTVSGTPGATDFVCDSEMLEAEKFMSPYWQVDADSAPMYMIHGEADEAVLISHAYAMEAMALQYMDESDVKTTYYPECAHVEKKYMDAYAQYVSSYEFVEEKRNSYVPEKKEDEPVTPAKKGCSGSIAVTSALLSCIALAGVALVFAKKQEN